MNDNTSDRRATALFVSHGGGPLPLLGDAAHRQLVDSLKVISVAFPRPAAIILVSAHWEADRPTVTGADNPALIYDYYNFPPASYEIRYPAPGQPALAAKIHSLLVRQGIDAAISDHRGFDHGLFVPLKIMYPEADIPCVQLSLVKGLDPGIHLQMGRALASLPTENVLVIGSGFSFHNLPAFFRPGSAAEKAMNADFEQWLIDTCSSDRISESERHRRLVNWAEAPAARFCHPREEHLLPLHVCYGVADSPARQVFRFEVMGKQASAFLW